MLHCTPFLLFDGNCAEAMTFYHQCLGGELTLTKLGDTPMKDQFPLKKHNRMINNGTCRAIHLIHERCSTTLLTGRHSFEWDVLHLC